MKVVIAIDSFKGSLSSMEAGRAAAAGVRKALNAPETKDVQVVVKPLADGGEGTTGALVEGLGGIYSCVQVTGPFGKPVIAQYGILGDGITAVMEMAEAAGITLADKNGLNPWKATTYGVGEMIRDAIRHGCRKFIIGIGGSATTEGGVSMLMALGYEFLKKDGTPITPDMQELEQIEQISDAHVIPELKECQFQIACDVKNPLYGEKGAVYVYGPQKGVKEDEKEIFDTKMKHYAAKSAEFTGKDCSLVEGAGAAGGLGHAFISYLPNVELRPGIEIVLEAIRFEDELADADVVITGEGRMDAQTAMGKVPVGVAKLAKKYPVKVIAFAGGVTEDAVECNRAGIDAFFPIVRGVTTLEEAMKPDTAKKNMTLAVEQVFRLL
ncbi:MAG: glycerate kinase [Roseburia sp.]|nr:glycerate kinase [Roseburia sp.]